ncbi:MAG TPA: winged helix DNA-binding domain-containing protein [Candidatus Saccharimonadales bacterium]|nr:winged helix DNA-binding domain-containing protein [Candidatus Saccharimonadales bacterium]
MRDELLPLRLARLRSQHLTDDTRLAADVAGITASVFALQAQAFDAARHQVRVRSEGLTAGAVDRAFEVERSVVRTWLMRGTLHLCAAEDLRWLLDVFGPAIDHMTATRRRNLGLDDATCARGVAVIRKVLANGPIARGRIREDLVSAGVLEEPVGQTLVHLICHAAALGVVCSGPRMGRDDSFVLIDDWVAPDNGPRGTAALAEVALRYFRAYGPASEADFAAWSGLRRSVIRPAMAAIGSRLVEFPGATRGLWTLGPIEKQTEIAGPAVRLLGHFDTFLLGYRRREHLGGAEAEAWIHDGGGGWIRPVVLVDGWISGGWRLDRKSRDAEITVMPFDRIGRRADPAIGREVASIGSFLERPARWSRGPLVGFNSTPT